MLEDMTYENILKRMLNRVPNNVDKRQGGIIYDALSPAAAELTQVYIYLRTLENSTYADTSTDEDLTRRAAERGVERIPATKAVRKGIFKGNNGIVFNPPIGSRFTGDNLNYVAIQKVVNGEFRLECETMGDAGNSYIGQLIPVDYIDGLTFAEITDILIPGENEEGDEHLRNRYFNSLESQSYGGNVSDYKERTNKLNGVGGTKVYPAWNGGGTVKLVIIDSEHNTPSTELIEQVQTSIDPVPNKGLGFGIAPIGHVVAIEGVVNSIINIETSLIYQDGYTWEDVKSGLETVINEYFLELRKVWEGNSNIVVRISHLETRILNVAGVLDIQSTKINGIAENFVLADIEVPILGEVIVT